LIFTLALSASALSLGSGCGDDGDDGADGADAGSSGRTQGGAGAQTGGRSGGTGGGSTNGGAPPSGGSGGSNSGGSGAQFAGAGAGGVVAGAGGAEAGAGGQNGEAEDLVGDRRIPFTPQTDREFIHFFIEHHEMAVEMAEVVVDKGSRADVRQLAEEIIAAQTREIEVLRDADEELQNQPEPPEMPADPHQDADMEHMMTMTGTTLDRMFLLDMIPHHAAALPVAHRARPHLTRDDLRTMAEEIVHQQAVEIGQIKEILDALNVMSAGEDMAPAETDRPDFGLVGDRRVPLTPEDDVTFIDFFVPHHEMAVEMAEHVLTHGENLEVRDLAEMMRTNQMQEIETMQSVREEVAGDAEPSPMPTDPHMETEMQEMMNASGTELDVMFLEEMIAHHAAGLPTAHRANPHVQNSELRTMADDIYHAQAEEIGAMERLREELTR
jgi:uncharacterized protein (DUF305 family)